MAHSLAMQDRGKMVAIVPTSEPGGLRNLDAGAATTVGILFYVDVKRLTLRVVFAAARKGGRGKRRMWRDLRRVAALVNQKVS